MSGPEMIDFDGDAYESLFQGIGDAVIVHDSGGTILEVNDFACRQLGYRRGELVGKSVSTIISGTIEDQLSDRIERVIDDGSATFESTHLRKSGEEIPVEIIATHQRAGEEDIIVSIARDITDRKQREQELEVVKARYKSLFEENPLVIWEEDLSATKERLDEIRAETESVGAYLRDNPAVLDELLETVEIIGVNRTAVDYYEADSKADLLANFDRTFTEAAHEILVSEFAAIARGETRFRAETKSRTLDGDVQEELIDLYVPEAASEDYSRVFVTSTDISERKARERELETVNERLELALEAGQFGVWDWNIPSDEVTFDDRWAKMLGYSLAEIDPRLEAWEQRVHPDDQERVDAALDEHLEGETELYECEHRLQTKSGEWIWVRDVGRVVEWEDGEPIRAVGIHADITDRKQQQQELEAKNERLDEFASVISHDLRNPLNVAQGRAQLIQEETDSPHTASLVDALERIEEIVEDTLVLAREGETVETFEPIVLSELLGQCWGMVETGEATLQVENEFTIHGDRKRLRQVFENLFRNAVEHGGTDVTVRVGHIPETGFYVEDDGEGIPEKKWANVFEAGYTSAESGTGFGLAIVRTIAQAHGWTVSITESRQGGARFEFSDVSIQA